MSAQLTAVEAAARLGVQRASLYAYVSRGLLHRTVSEDGKTSLFDAQEIEAFSRRRRGRPPMGTVDVVLSTSLTRIADEGVWFRNRPLATIVREWTFEQTAEWLWHGIEPSAPEWPRPTATHGTAAERPGTDGASGMSPTMALLHRLAISDRSPVDTADPVAIARQLIVDFADAAALNRSTARRRVPSDASIAERLAVRFGRPELVDTIDVILVLMADHEIASSTLAARVAASARADAYAVVAAGLATLSGTLHGGVTRLAVELIERSAQIGADAELDRRLSAGERLPGFGHSVYRALDPRAALLFDHLASTDLPAERLAVAQQVMAAARSRMSARANIDLALGSFVYAAKLPATSAEWLFAIARTAGWVAHAIEEYAERPLRFRPRSLVTSPGNRC